MKKVFITLTLCLLGLYISAQTIEKTYSFTNPIFEQANGYEQITFPGCMQAAEPGQPSMPWQSISLLLPQNTEAQSIEVEFSDFKDIEGSHILYPYQQARPLSETKPIKFAKDEAVYGSRDIYPVRNQSDVKTHYLNGCSFAFSGFTPVRYIPSEGKISYAQKVTVRVKVTASKSDKSNMVWMSPEIKSRIERLAQNPEAINSYSSNNRSIGGYELLVITPAEWVSSFDEYKELYDARGLRTRVTSLEDIYASAQGVDNQDKIRNFVKQEYEDNGILMVLLGGDVALVPYRGLYCYVSDEYVDTGIPADMYYSCLDGTWNDNNNNYWGEVGEDDLLPELGIARMPFNNETQFNNMMHKTLAYQRTPVLGEFRNVILGGEHLGDGYYGSNDLELLIGEHDNDDYTTIGIPENYSFDKVYAEEGIWSGGNLRKAMNKGGQYTHHVGHANTDYVAGWYNSTINDNSFASLNGVDHNYTFFHSHGCICGDYSSNCILEKLVTMSTCCVATTGNSRYGWYIPWGDGPGRHLNREFVDAYFHERLPYIGLAFVEMKIQTAPNVNTYWGDNGALRWNFYDINVLGDVAVCPWLDEPFIPNVQYTPALIVGSTSTSVTIDKDDVMQSNFRCSLFHNDELIAFGMTDDSGVANLEFNSPLNIADTMQLIITGPNALPQTYNVIGFEEGVPYVYLKDYVVDDNQGNNNGKIDFGETINLNIDFYNGGTISANNVTATLSCVTANYIEITNNNVEIGSINAQSSEIKDNAFSFNISDNIPDESFIDFVVTISDGTNTWLQDLSIKVLAPKMEILNITYEDIQGNNNGFVDAGETIMVHLTGINSGHSIATNTSLTGTCNAEYLNFTNNPISVGNININETSIIDFEFTVDDNTPDGSAFSVIFDLVSGNYVAQSRLNFTVGTIVENFETGDFSHLEWSFDHDLPWVITDSISHSGSYCAETGAIADNEITSMIVEFENMSNGTISFFFKTSTENKKDYLVFYLDNKLLELWTGENGWTEVSFDVASGLHTAEWRYDKSPNGQDGADRCWIDDIIFPGNTIILDVMEITENKDVTLYPNPATEQIFITGKEIQQIDVYNTMGQRISSNIYNNVSSVTLNVNDIAKGIYIVRIIDANEQIINKKVIKK